MKAIHLKNSYYYYSGNGKDLQAILDKQERYDPRGYYEYPQPFDTYELDDHSITSDWDIYEFEKKEDMFNYLLQCILNGLQYNYYKNVSVVNIYNMEADKYEDVYHMNMFPSLEMLTQEFLRDNEELVSYIYQLLNIQRHKTLYYEIVEKALRPNRVGLWLADHIANGKEVWEFEP
jgi:hypothetical protein